MTDQKRHPLPPAYIARIREGAKKALSRNELRRNWADSEFSSPVMTMQLCAEIARLNIELERANEADAWSTDLSQAPTEPYEFFLVRPKGLHPARGMVFHPTIVQRIDGKFYTAENELEPIYFGQDEADDHPLKATLEWRHFPADWLVPSGRAAA